MLGEHGDISLCKFTLKCNFYPESLKSCRGFPFRFTLDCLKFIIKDIEVSICSFLFLFYNVHHFMFIKKTTFPIKNFMKKCLIVKKFVT